ncbi:RNA-binding protein Hfq [bioreactor metagenome]|uniref:RNA-binding protein Hfq n=1 Tax=bioreactor metagenome TaxID=1076179 RepID=A0A645D901_9ZZZZ
MKNMNLQDLFLNTVRKERTPLTVYLLSGYQLRGTVRGFDSFVVMLDCDGKQNMVYKHAISTIIPAKNVTFVADAQDDE